MQWSWKAVQSWLVHYRDHGELAPEVVPVVQGWIEVQVSRYGSDLEREDTCQELWIFVLEKVIPKLNTKLGNWNWWISLCIRQEISKIRKRKQQLNREVPHIREVEDDGEIQEV